MELGMKSAKRMKCWGRKKSWLDGKFGEKQGSDLMERSGWKRDTGQEKCQKRL